MISDLNKNMFVIRSKAEIKANVIFHFVLHLISNGYLNLRSNRVNKAKHKIKSKWRCQKTLSKTESFHPVKKCDFIPNLLNWGCCGIMSFMGHMLMRSCTYMSSQWITGDYVFVSVARTQLFVAWILLM